MIENKAAQGGNVEIEISGEVAEGRYANLAVISHSTSEFIIDFATLLPGNPHAKVHSREILTPEHAKRLLYSLQENINRYESRHGSIPMQQEQMAPQDIISSKLS